LREKNIGNIKISALQLLANNMFKEYKDSVEDEVVSKLQAVNRRYLKIRSSL